MDDARTTAKTCRADMLTGEQVTDLSAHGERENQMAAMKPRTGDGPMEVTKEGRSLILRVPIDGGGRLVLELNAEEASNLKDCLLGVTDSVAS